MAEKRSKILIEAQRFAEEQLSQPLTEDLKYHSINHTYDVVNAVSEICRQCNLSQADREIVELSAWFHDLGYQEMVEKHEEVSANMALDFLAERKYDDKKAAQVAGCIMATKLPQTPNNKLEAILCDADMMHLAREDYFSKAELLHDELQEVKGKKITDAEWLESSKNFIHNHRFFTKYAQKMYAEKKNKNLTALKEKLRKARLK